MRSLTHLRPGDCTPRGLAPCLASVLDRISPRSLDGLARIVVLDQARRRTGCGHGCRGVDPPVPKLIRVFASRWEEDSGRRGSGLHGIDCIARQHGVWSLISFSGLMCLSAALCGCKYSSDRLNLETHMKKVHRNEAYYCLFLS
jgi:hypothetical protein